MFHDSFISAVERRGGRGSRSNYGWSRRRLWLLVAAAAVATSAAPARAQDHGVIAGLIVDSRNAAPLSTAQVFIPALGLGTVTDLNGRYRLADVPAGTHEVRIESLGYQAKTLTGVVVEAGKTTALDISLQFAPIEVEGIKVTAAAEKGSIDALLNAQKNAIAVMDAVGSEQIARSPDRNAAEVVSRVTGVTVAEGRYVYIRGLGERYSQTLFSGSPMPSPEPEKEAVPLDLFPSAFVESIATQKTYTPDLPGEFSGGSVNVENKEFPTELKWNLTVGTGANTNSQFQNNFFTYAGGRTDWLGRDDGTRAIPDVITEAGFGLRGERLPVDDTEAMESFGRAFAEQLPQFAPQPQTTPANLNFRASLGARTGNFGWLIGGSYDDRYVLVDDEVEAKWRAESFDPSLPEDTRQPNVRYGFNRSARATVLGAMGNFSYLFSPTQQISLRTMFNRNTDNEARLLGFPGENREDLGGNLYGERLRFQERQLIWGQLSGEHGLNVLDSRLDWRFVLGRAQLEEPGLRETIYNQTFGQPDTPWSLEDVGESSRYFYSDLEDDEINGGLDWVVPLGMGANDEGFVKVGFFMRSRDRAYAARLYRFTYVSGVIDRNPAVTDGSQGIDAIVANPDNIVGSSPGPGELLLQDIVQPGDVYDASDDRIGGYGMAEFPIGGAIKLMVGARLEDYDLRLSTPSEALTDFHQTDILPALNFTVALNDEMNLRLAGSRTLDRPEFRELSPFQFTEALSLRQLFGNPALEVAEITNADVRWEWFPASGEVLSVSGFYKHLQDPIEQVYISTASTAWSFQNADSGDLFGGELTFRKRLGFLGEFGERLWLGGNALIAKSTVTVIPGGVFEPTNLKRPLEGQSPYAANVDLSYLSPGGNTDLGIFFNVYGDRIEAAGGSGIPDIVEQSRNLLDFTWVQSVWRGIRVKVKVENILNSPFRWEQENNGIVQIQREFTVGQTFSVGFSYGN